MMNRRNRKRAEEVVRSLEPDQGIMEIGMDSGDNSDAEEVDAEADADADETEGIDKKDGENYYPEVLYPHLPEKLDQEWQYTMRRTMQQVLPGLHLGPYAAATKAKLADLKEAGITHIVCVRDFLERNFIRPQHKDSFKYLVVEISDKAHEPIIPHFRVVNDFVDAALATGGRVLIHGNAGISRSCALVIAYVMAKYGVPLKEAYIFVQDKRFCCNPNEGFMAQLREYEPIYRAMHTVPKALPGSSLSTDSDSAAAAGQLAGSSGNKRPLEEMEEEVPGEIKQ